MIKKILYVVTSPLQERDCHRYGVYVMEGCGYDVEVYDCSPFIHPDLYKYGAQRGRSDRATVFSNEDEFLRRFEQLEGDVFVIPMTNYNRKTYKIFKTLSKKKIRYAMSVVNAVPEAYESKYLTKRIAGLSFSKIYRFLREYLYMEKYARYLGIRGPDIIMAGGTKSVEHQICQLVDDHTETIWAHTYDYDLYLEDIQSPDGLANQKGDYAVYLDMPGPKFKRDDYTRAEPVCPYTESNFYPAMCKLFRKIEDELGLEVRIAGHPGGNHEERPVCFEGRWTQHGCTYEMIKNCRIAIATDSASIIFAVILNKPVLFVNTNEGEKHPYVSNIIGCNARWLGKKVINIDSMIDDINWDRELAIDSSAYSNYKRCYIKREGSPQINTWRILADRIKSL